MSTKAEQLEWRRGKVIELRTRGLSYAEIASELQVTKTAVAEDMLYLRKRAKESIKEYVTEHLPEQYQIALRALDTILKHAYEILQEAHDNREKVAALELFKDTHMTKLELLSNATTIDHALEYIRSKQHQKKVNEDASNSNSQLSAAGKQSVF
jgi:transcriptional regulator